MEKYVKKPMSDIVERTTRKTIHEDKMADDPKDVVENVLGKPYKNKKMLKY